MTITTYKGDPRANMSIGTVLNIPVELIDTAPQVRTKFKEETIAELAADIRAHGILQPLVVQQRGQRFTLLIGERRLRAIRYLGDTTAPAILATVSADMAEEVQLMENIQRENLNTADLAEAIKGLWKKHGSVTEVARRCNKSPSWVSKRLALALDVGISTAALLDANVKDVEMLYTFAKLEKINPKKARQIMTAVMDGTLGREDVKEWLLANDDAPALPTIDPEKNLNLPLFQQTLQTDAPADPIEAAPVPESVYSEHLRQQYAVMYEALEAIRDFDKTLRPQQKAEAMRNIARNTLNSFKNSV
ncbi:MAG: ParB/RepB/Spo0J family partition protein [Rhodocyclales bacterium]|nr:ParB/RepB/Spo0J family partition protein [Rhodocyclales bacterium]